MRRDACAQDVVGVSTSRLQAVRITVPVIQSSLMMYTTQVRHRLSASCNLASRRCCYGGNPQGAMAARLWSFGRLKATTATWASRDDTATSWSIDRALGAVVPAIAYATLIFYVGVTSTCVATAASQLTLTRICTDNHKFTPIVPLFLVVTASQPA
jgi:hypothetical protein